MEKHTNHVPSAGIAYGLLGDGQLLDYLKGSTAVTIGRSAVGTTLPTVVSVFAFGAEHMIAEVALLDHSALATRNAVTSGALHTIVVAIEAETSFAVLARYQFVSACFVCTVEATATLA